MLYFDNFRKFKPLFFSTFLTFLITPEGRKGFRIINRINTKVIPCITTKSPNDETKKKIRRNLRGYFYLDGFKIFPSELTRETLNKPAEIILICYSKILNYSHMCNTHNNINNNINNNIIII